LRALDDFSLFERLLRLRHLGLQRLELRVASRLERNSGLELPRVDGLRQVRAGPSRDRSLDQPAIVDAGDHDDRAAEAARGELCRGGEAVELRHLDVEEIEMPELDGLSAA